MKIVSFAPCTKEVPIKYSFWSTVVHIFGLWFDRNWRPRPATKKVAVEVELIISAPFSHLKQGRKYTRLKVGDYIFYGITPVELVKPYYMSAKHYRCTYTHYKIDSGPPDAYFSTHLKR